MLLARRVGAALIAAGLLATASCGSTKDTFPTATKPTINSYVAMGDSYVSGPGIAPEDPASHGCERSTRNYPALLAKALHVTTFHDASCSGAISSDILVNRPTTAQTGAQIDAVTADTDLVTVGIGGNDESVFGRVIYACASGDRADTALCAPTDKGFVTAALARTTSRVATTLERIHSKAPHARIILVGYLRVVPAPGGCVIPGLTAARSVSAITAQDMLDTALAEAAKQAKVDYISMSTLSAGHESCDGPAAWINGLRIAPGDGAYLHPNAAGMRAVAHVLAKELR